MVNLRSSQAKHVIHGFFLAVATTIAEPATILPVIISFFSANPLVIGLFASLLKGGAILVQIVAAFWAQSYPRMMPYLYFVFAARFFSWFGIGLVIVLLGESHPALTLLLMGVGFFIFSFAAGFGTVYFNEILAKVFTHNVRGRVTAIRQFMAGIGAISSGAATGYILTNFEAPQSFGYLFMVSALLMLVGIVAFATIKEPSKEHITPKEERFRNYLKNTMLLLRSDQRLQIQISAYLLSYSYLFALPFIILDAQAQIGLTGATLGIYVSLQMTGAMVSNILWGWLSFKGRNKCIVIVSFLFSISVMLLALLGGSSFIYALIFFLMGAAIDGFKLAFGNLILIIAPEQKRPIYIALQSNLTSIGLFFALPGSIILALLGYTALYFFTLTLLIFGIYFSFKYLTKES